MSLPKGYLPREGDVLLMRGRVKFDVESHETDVHIVPDDYHHAISVPLAAIAGVNSRTWRVNDWVRSTEDLARGDIGQVRAVEGDSVWVRLTSGAYGSFEMGELEAASHPNGAPMFAPDGTMLDDQGNRSIFDDVDE